jgi:hypothetical protein
MNKEIQDFYNKIIWNAIHLDDRQNWETLLVPRLGQSRNCGNSQNPWSGAVPKILRRPALGASAR